MKMNSKEWIALHKMLELPRYQISEDIKRVLLMISKINLHKDLLLIEIIVEITVIWKRYNYKQLTN